MIDWKSKTRGEKTEQQLKPLIAQHHGVADEDIIKQDPFSTIDFMIGDDTYIEIKERFAQSTTFADSMFPINKYNFCVEKAKEGKQVYLYLKYYDGIFYYKFHSHSQDDFNFREGGRCDRGVNEVKWYSYLKAEKVLPLNVALTV